STSATTATSSSASRRRSGSRARPSPCAATSCSCPTRRRSGPSSTPSACPDRMPGPVLSERDLAVLRSFARRIDPSDAGAHNNLGVLYYQKGLIEDAITELARAHAALGRHPEAIAEFQALLAWQPGDVPAMLQLGLAEKARGNLDTATD